MVRKKSRQYGEFFILLFGCIVSIVATCNSYETAAENKDIADSSALANASLQKEIFRLHKASDSIQLIINNSNDTIKNLQRVIIGLQGLEKK